MLILSNQLSWFFVFLILAAYYSASETAINSLPRTLLKRLNQTHPKRYKTLSRLLEDPKKLSTTFWVATNLFNFTACIVATHYAIQLLENIGLSNPVFQLAIISLTLSLIIVFTVQMAARFIGLKFAETLALQTCRFILWSYTLLYPFIWGLNILSFALTKAFRLPKQDVFKLITSEAILRLIQQEPEEKNHLKPAEEEMLNSIFSVSETVVREIMTPRTDMVSLDVDSSVSKAIQIINQYGHSRIPVFEEKPDNIVGMIYAKDLLGLTDTTSSIRRSVRSAVFIPETKNCVDLLHQMKKSKFHLAIVVDEYGGISGVVSIEDIIEEIIGEIQDEYDTDEQPKLTPLGPNRYWVDASINISDLSHKIDCEFPDEEDFDTLGGFVLSYLGKFPQKGESFTYNSFQFTIKDLSKRRILSIEIQRLNPTEESIGNS